MKNKKNVRSKSIENCRSPVCMRRQASLGVNRRIKRFRICKAHSGRRRAAKKSKVQNGYQLIKRERERENKAGSHQQSEWSFRKKATLSVISWIKSKKDEDRSVPRSLITFIWKPEVHETTIAGMIPACDPPARYRFGIHYQHFSASTDS